MYRCCCLSAALFHSAICTILAPLRTYPNCTFAPCAPNLSLLDFSPQVNAVGGSAAGSANETDVMHALQHAPVAAAFTVGTEFELYVGGVISDCGVGGNHIMEIVGYSDVDPDHNNTAYWIVKNTWGTAWGENGYAYIAKDQVGGWAWGG
jgi:hypothetical protein